MTQEAQEHTVHELHTPGTSSALANQVEQSTRKRLMMAREKQENTAQAPHASGTTLNLADNGEQDTPKQPQQGLPQSPTLVRVPQDRALQDYHMQWMLLENQNKKRLMLFREEHEKAAQAPHAPGTSSDPADQIELPRATDATQHHAELGFGRLPDAKDAAPATP
ncbi:uncharacterized protein TRUGW13939_07849 [Talaromyces rugulosus]|uniref:Uncharacterized protein n=1 Tax=Talaromyces rugulosus TaxID=121627 RepID=A0A7H8R782_TALRU|nr:uncharacterized protein TRUGW13939_07849 [Talaromyces rugulosus]QKX60703.1 hypothetical protein TRUGW13939_07849 [Talaromyces rugulosus]